MTDLPVSAMQDPMTVYKNEVVQCPVCHCVDLDITEVIVYMGTGFLDVNVLDAVHVWKYDPEPTGYKIPSVHVFFACACGTRFDHSYGSAAIRDCVPFVIERMI